MPTLSPTGAALIQRFEACRLAAYPDPATGGAPWTIGWGSTGKDIHQGLTWTQAQADARFQADAAHLAAGVAALLGDAPASQNQFDALCCFAYNVGLGNLKASTLLRHHCAGHPAQAAAEFARWNKAAGKVLAGLSKRRAAEAALYLNNPSATAR